MGVIIFLIVLIVLVAVFMKDGILKKDEMIEAKDNLKEFKKALQEECFSRLVNTETGKNIRKIYNYEEIYNEESLDITLEAFQEVFQKTKKAHNEIAFNNMNHYLVKYYTDKILEFGNSSHKEILSKSIISLRKDGKI